MSQGCQQTAPACLDSAKCAAKDSIFRKLILNCLNFCSLSENREGMSVHVGACVCRADYRITQNVQIKATVSACRFNRETPNESFNTGVLKGNTTEAIRYMLKLPSKCTTQNTTKETKKINQARKFRHKPSFHMHYRCNRKSQ